MWSVDCRSRAFAPNDDGRPTAGCSPVPWWVSPSPFLFGTVVKGLATAGVSAHARIVVEKPFGHDLASARALADELHLYLRFANTILEPVWNRNHVECVETTMARELRD